VDDRDHVTLVQRQIEAFGRFVRARQAALIDEIRKACGITPASSGATEHVEADEVAADVKDGTAPAYEPAEGLQFEAV